MSSTNAQKSVSTSSSSNPVMASQTSQGPPPVTMSVTMPDGSIVPYRIPPMQTPRCKCGKIATPMRSWTAANAGRIYYCCSSKQQKCDYFLWVAPIMEAWYNGFPKDAYDPQYNQLFKPAPSKGAATAANVPSVPVPGN